MKKMYFLLASVIFCCTNLFAQNIIGAEMLGRPANTGVSVKVIFDDSVQARVSYGTVNGTYPLHTTWQTVYPDTVGESVVQIDLTGLTSDTKYFYKLQYRKPGDTVSINRTEHSFHTARPAGETFTFDIQADPHLDAASDTALYRVCLKNQLDDAPDFMIDLGDNFMTDKLKTSGTQVVPEDTIPYRCKLLRSYYASVNHSVPLFLVLGNHEGECGWYNNGASNNMAVWDTKYRKKYYTNPVPDGFYSGDTTQYNFVGLREAYYSWTWGDAQFIVLDPFWNTSPKPDSLHCWRWTLGKIQYDWLKTTLENSTSKFKFVFIHNLVGGDAEGRGGIEKANNYEWGGLNIDGTNGWSANRAGWDKPIKDLLTEHRVTILFHGHDHFFGKQIKDCLLYQECPQPSLPNFTNTPQAATYGYVNGLIIPNAGHIRVTVSPTGVTAEYVRALRTTQETSTLHNKDVSETYHIGLINCYDSLQSGISNSWNEHYNLVTVYPNPASKSLVVQTETIKDYDRKIDLINMTGETVASCLLKKDNAFIKLDMADVAPGIYFIKIYDGVNSSFFKVSVTR